MIFIQILLDKQWDHPIIKHICINAGLAMQCVGTVNTIKEGYFKALDLFKSEAVVETINLYKETVVDLESV